MWGKLVSSPARVYVVPRRAKDMGLCPRVRVYDLRLQFLTRLAS